jgi:hypothetical protein
MAPSLTVFIRCDLRGFRCPSHVNLDSESLGALTLSSSET